MKTLHRIPTDPYAYLEFEFDEEAKEGENSKRFEKNLDAHFAMLSRVKKKLSTLTSQS